MAETKLPASDKGWQAHLQNLRPTGQRRYVNLGGGLAVTIGVAGDILFQARLKRPGAKHATREPLGWFPATSVSAARAKLMEVRALVREGRDPAVERKRPQEAQTFGQLVDRYLERRVADDDLRPKTLQIEREVLTPIVEALGDRLLSDLEPRDFNAVIEREARRLKDAGGTGRNANMALAASKRVFKHARRSGDFMAVSPVEALGRPVREKARNRVLFDGEVLVDKADRAKNELGALVSALSGGAFRTTQETRVALMLTLLLGLRVSEAAGLKWAAIHLTGEIPTLDILKGKTESAERTLPLPTQAVALLRAVPKVSDYVFPPSPEKRTGAGKGRAPHLHPESVSRALARIFERLGIEGAVEHDMRRTCLSGIVELTGDEGLAERIAGHKGKTTLTRHYDQSKRLKHMLAALQQWADAVDYAARRADQ